MANTRELLRRRKGIQNTKKITRTMELISTAKLKKISNKIIASRPYKTELLGLLRELLRAEVSLDLADKRPQPSAVTVVAIASNRGLCGAYNVKVVERAILFIEEQKSHKRQVQSYIIGKRALSMFLHRRQPITREFGDIDDRTSFGRIKSMAQEMISDFLQGKLDRVYVVYTAFRSRSKQKVDVAQLLPISPRENNEEQAKLLDYTFEPSAKTVLAEIAPLAVEIDLYHMLLEAMASEQAYRMRTMKNATENAEKMIKELTQKYNRARQTQITMELLDILGGVGVT